MRNTKEIKGIIWRRTTYCDVGREERNKEREKSGRRVEGEVREDSISVFKLIIRKVRKIKRENRRTV